MSNPNTTSYDSLPYLDPEPSVSQRKVAEDLIAAHLPTTHKKTPHPSLPPLPESISNLTTTAATLMQKELKRKSRDPESKMENGVDMSRYEAPDEPTADADEDEYRAALRRAYTSATYLRNRHGNLVLLEEYGKNAWLMGNAALEAELAAVRGELEEVMAQTEEVNRQRKQAQEGSRSEVEVLEETWQKGVGRGLEVQIATAGLKQEVERMRREMAGTVTANAR